MGKWLMRLRSGAKDKFEFNPMLDDLRLVYELERNVFNGNVSLQLQIVHLEQYQITKSAQIERIFLLLM